MRAFRVALCAIVYWTSVQGATVAVSNPAIPTAGTNLAEDFNKNMAAVEQNLYKGAVSVADPAFKFTVDTAPDVLQLWAMLNGVNVPPFLAAMGKDLLGKAAFGGGNTIGGAGVLASAILGNAMEVNGKMLQVQNKIMEDAARAGINLGAKFADHLMNATNISANITADGLKALGDGLLAAAAGSDVFSEGVSKLLDAISVRLEAAIKSAHEFSTKIMSGLPLQFGNGLEISLDANGLESTTKALNVYTTTLTSIQEAVNRMISDISVKASLPSGVTFTAGTSSNVV